MSITPGFQQAEYYSQAPEPAFDGATFLRAVAFGVVGMLAGAVLYSGFTILTNIQIGFVALVVAWLVAKAMSIASSERGGTPYQIAAVILTCGSIFMANSIMVWWYLHLREPVPLSLINLVELAIRGVELPFLEIQHSPGSGIISLIILFVGLRAAWRMTSGRPGAARHPFSR